MNDFLHKLRTGQQDRRSTNRRQYTNPMYRGSERRDGKDFRKGDRRKPQADTITLDPEIVSDIKHAVENVSEGLKQLTASEERLAEAQERTASAMELIAEYLKSSVLTNPEVQVSPVSLPNTNKISNQEIVNHPANISAGEVRDKVVDIILRMREAGSTYDKIAMYLEQENIPTFSGKGNWHAQTVHRIFRQYV